MSKVATTTKSASATKSAKRVTPTTPVVTETPTPTVTEPTVTETMTVTETTVEEVGPSVVARLEELIKSHQTTIETLKKEIVTLRKLMKDHQLEVKQASKNRKKKVTNPNAKPRRPSGFAEPVIVSDHMYKFLSQFGVEPGVPIARTEITKHVIAYIKQHDLQNPERRREIVPDAVLGKLFGPALEHRDPADPSTPKVYSYLKLQKYLSNHFPKKAVATATATATASK
jgi:chromatin remodeling complex protein RSC6